MPFSLSFTIPILCLLLALASYIFSTTRHYLRLAHIPGPFWCRISNLPRLYWVYRRNAHEVHIAQHRQYGSTNTNKNAPTEPWAPLTTYGPNAVSIGSAFSPSSSSSIIETIYPLRTPLQKSNFYTVIPPMRKGVILPAIFSTQDEGLHRMLKRPIAGVYSMSNVVSFEPLVDSTIAVFRQELERRFVCKEEDKSEDKGRVCDFGVWLQYFAFDVVGEMTFSKRLGFLEEGRDVEGIIASIWHWFEYVAVLWVKNPLISRLRPARWSPMVQFANKREAERRAMASAGHVASSNDVKVNDRDFLSRFQAALDKDPSIPRWALQAWTSSNILAGSDTTAIFLRSIFHNLLTHPSTLQKLRSELDAANLSSPVLWKETHFLPYLHAVFKEAGRLHPPFGLHLERIVPPGGLEICGQTLPAGTIVGMNAWVVHRDPEVFGNDAEEWRPERWLEGGEKIKRMEAALLTFGAGNRVCLGKHISYLEIFKLVPTLLQAYEFELLDEARRLKVENRWFVPQSGFFVRLRERRRE
ncbi:putative benzoate 4-monooxygenase cytochrome P450 [Astrocystis sublimbata]|nr:putative benzoate 4-monooxygenase cytochrome P450 [Astrocystis sublimbata]